jgi:hypothetical protein
MLTNTSIIVDVSMVDHSQVVEAHGPKVIRAAGLLFVVHGQFHVLPVVNNKRISSYQVFFPCSCICNRICHLGLVKGSLCAAACNNISSLSLSAFVDAASGRLRSTFLIGRTSTLEKLLLPSSLLPSLLHPSLLRLPLPLMCHYHHHCRISLCDLQDTCGGLQMHSMLHLPTTRPISTRVLIGRVVGNCSKSNFFWTRLRSPVRRT